MRRSWYNDLSHMMIINRYLLLIQNEIKTIYIIYNISFKHTKIHNIQTQYTPF